MCVSSKTVYIYHCKQQHFNYKIYGTDNSDNINAEDECIR